MSAAALEAIDGIVNRAGDADDILRDVVATLVGCGTCAWAGILFREDGELLLGPQAGEPRPVERAQTPVLYQGQQVAELVVDGCADQALLEPVAILIGAHCLVGWDTGGVPWDAVS
jgi:hypothetical protein